MSGKFALPALLLAAALGAAGVARASVDEGPRRWNLHVDNDFFAFGNTDRDYTAGFAFALEGKGSATETAAREFGVLLFTPHALEATAAQFDDRPYANLTYIGRTRLVHEPGSRTARQTSLVFGFLGLPFVEQLHRTLHDAMGAVVPRGYEHQISAGGEPTFRYAVSGYRLLAADSFAGRPYSIRLGLGAGAGYITEGNVELGLRWGTATAPWWSAFSESADYAGHPGLTPLRRAYDSAGPAVQFSAGMKLRARLYNSFLQGQFRHSDVTYSSSEVNHWLYEAWIGMTAVFDNHLSVSYTIRHQSKELETGRGARGFTWASVNLGKGF